MILLPARAAPSHDAELTLYSNGNIFTTGAPYANHGAFLGWIFDNDQPIGFIQPKHFLTLRLSPGPHRFSASTSTKHSANNSQLAVVLAEGKKYYIRVQEESRGYLVIGSERGRLDLVTCQIALQEAANAHPTDPKHISQGMRDKIASATSLPPCE
ncbi:MAG: hypothetical protein KGM96_12280 [Acidobacteriota bacterium]|nr:hypothetical protein [Acidobacteriota bacterium]